MTDDELVEAVAKAIGLANHETPESITRLIRDSHGELVETWVTYLPLARAIIPLVREAEREECAALVEQWNGSTRDGDTFHIAAAIRERGEHTQESQP